MLTLTLEKLRGMSCSFEVFHVAEWGDSDVEIREFSVVEQEQVEALMQRYAQLSEKGQSVEKENIRAGVLALALGNGQGTGERMFERASAEVIATIQRLPHKGADLVFKRALEYNGLVDEKKLEEELKKNTAKTNRGEKTSSIS